MLDLDIALIQPVVFAIETAECVILSHGPALLCSVQKTFSKVLVFMVSKEASRGRQQVRTFILRLQYAR